MQQLANIAAEQFLEREARPGDTIFKARGTLIFQDALKRSERLHFGVGLE